MSENDVSVEEDDASMKDANSSDSEEESFDAYVCAPCVEEPEMYYDRGRPLGTRYELVNSWMSQIFKDPERIWILENEVRRLRGKNDSDTPSRQRKGILARRTTPTRRTVSLEAAFSANTGALIAIACLSELLNMTHGNACPYNIHYYQGKERVEGVLYDFDQYSMQSIEKRKATPSQPMGQRNFNDLMRDLKESKESKAKDSKERREPEPENEDTEGPKLSNDAGD